MSACSEAKEDNAEYQQCAAEADELCSVEQSLVEQELRIMEFIDACCAVMQGLQSLRSPLEEHLDDVRFTINQMRGRQADIIIR